LSENRVDDPFFGDSHASKLQMAEDSGFRRFGSEKTTDFTLFGAQVNILQHPATLGGRKVLE
jgi:hypothetical protein